MLVCVITEKDETFCDIICYTQYTVYTHSTKRRKQNKDKPKADHPVKDKARHLP